MQKNSCTIFVRLCKHILYVLWQWNRNTRSKLAHTLYTFIIYASWPHNPLRRCPETPIKHKHRKLSEHHTIREFALAPNANRCKSPLRTIDDYAKPPLGPRTSSLDIIEHQLQSEAHQSHTQLTHHHHAAITHSLRLAKTQHLSRFVCVCVFMFAII